MEILWRQFQFYIIVIHVQMCKKIEIRVFFMLRQGNNLLLITMHLLIWCKKKKFRGEKWEIVGENKTTEELSDISLYSSVWKKNHRLAQRWHGVVDGLHDYYYWLSSAGWHAVSWGVAETWMHIFSLTFLGGMELQWKNWRPLRPVGSSLDEFNQCWRSNELWRCTVYCI